MDINGGGCEQWEQDNYGDIPLHCALKHGQTSCIKPLLRGRASSLSILIQNKGNKMPLEVAKNDDYKEVVKWVSLQDSDIVKHCIKAVSDLDLKNKTSEYLELCLADIQKMKEYDVLNNLSLNDLVLKYFLKPNSLSWEQYGNALDFDDSLAVYRPEVSEVKIKVQENRPTRSEVEIVGERATASDSTLSQDRVISQSATQLESSEDEISATWKTNENGDTALHSALKHGQTSCIKPLLRGEAPSLSILIQNKDNKFPLEVAKNDDYKEIVKWVSLQDSSIVKHCIKDVSDLDLKNKTSEYLELCLADIQKMKAHNVLDGLSLYDLVWNLFLETDGLPWELFGNALAFDDSLAVYGLEVSDVKRKVQQFKQDKSEIPN